MSRPRAANNFALRAQIEELRREREQSDDPMELVRGAYRKAINEAEARRKKAEADLPRPDPVRVGFKRHPE